MLQFNTYYHNEPSELKMFIKNIRELMFVDSTASRELVLRSRHLVVHKRFFLILVRLLYFGIIEKSLAIEIMEKEKNTFKTMNNFELSEIIFCFPELKTTLSPIYGHDRIKALVESTRQTVPTLPRDDESKSVIKFLIYKPRKSGFFSIIENIIAASYVCLYHGFRICVLNEEHWWPYEISFFDIFGDRWIQSSDIPRNLVAGELRFDAMRDLIGNLGGDQIRKFSSFKIIEYQSIRGQLAEFYNLVEKSEMANYYYHRAGDKVLLETPRLPLSNIRAELIKIANLHGPIGVISDSYSEAMQICNYSSKLNNLTDASFDGHFLDKSTKSSDVLAIIRNFLLLSESQLTLSCPSSNLVNAAQWAKCGELIAPNFPLHPITRYLLF